MIRTGVKRSMTTNSSVGSKTKSKLNASVLDGALKSVLEEASSKLRDISAEMAGHLEDQVANPEYVEGQDVVADRLIEWVADIFAISEDIGFYLNPPAEK